MSISKNNFILLKICLFGILLIAIPKQDLFAQSGPEIPADHPVKQAAPNLPKFERYEGVGHAFYGVNFSYKHDENLNASKEWKTNYPSEFESYQTAISDYLSSIDESLLTGIDNEIYSDLKSQWLMISQLN